MSIGPFITKAFITVILVTVFSCLALIALVAAGVSWLS